LAINGGGAALFLTSSSERPIHLRGSDHALELKARELLRGFGLNERIRVEWNPRLKTCAGRADFRERLISLNPRLRGLDADSSKSQAGADKLDCLKQSSARRATLGEEKRSGPREAVQDEIERTFLHELAHLLAQFRAGRRRILPHGDEWRRACVDLGIGDEKRCHTLPFPMSKRMRRFLYKCPNCKQVFPRVRRIRRAIACLACCRAHNGGEFDPRFRLRLCSGGL
jgi:SprT protein